MPRLASKMAHMSQQVVLGHAPFVSARHLALQPIYLLWFRMKPEEFWFQLRVGNRRFCLFTMGFIIMTRFNLGFKLNPGLKPNFKPDQINWVQVNSPVYKWYLKK